MKKISLLLAILMLFTAFGFCSYANEEVDPYATMLIDDLDDPYATMPIEEGDAPEVDFVKEEAMPQKIMQHGIVSEITEEYIMINDGSLRFNIDENTYIADYNLNPAQIKVGDMISAVTSTMTTMSIPPQNYAFFILINTENSISAPIYMKVVENKDGAILSEDGSYRAVYEKETPVIAHRIRIMLKAMDITEGSEILVFASTVGMSLPAHVPAEKIAVLTLAERKAGEIEKIMVDEESFLVSFEIKENLIPLRPLAEGLGFEVAWNGKANTVSLKKDDAEKTVTIGKKLSDTGEKEPEIIEDRTFVGIDIFNLLFGDNAKAEINDGVITVNTK